jgi:hypothetical protein
MHPTSEGNAFSSWLNDFEEWQVNGIEFKYDEDTKMDDSFMSEQSFDSVTASSNSDAAKSEVSSSLFARHSITK